MNRTSQQAMEVPSFRPVSLRIAWSRIVSRVESSKTSLFSVTAVKTSWIQTSKVLLLLSTREAIVPDLMSLTLNRKTTIRKLQTLWWNQVQSTILLWWLVSILFLITAQGLQELTKASNEMCVFASRKDPIAYHFQWLKQRLIRSSTLWRPRKDWSMAQSEEQKMILAFTISLKASCKTHKPFNDVVVSSSTVSLSCILAVLSCLTRPSNPS